MSERLAVPVRVTDLTDPQECLPADEGEGAVVGAGDRVEVAEVDPVLRRRFSATVRASASLRCDRREDAEKVGSVDRGILSDVPTEDWITESRRKVRIAKALGAASAVLSSQPDEIALRKLDAAANNRFERGITQIARGRAVVTDRLQVHICSLLLGRPHAVLDNSYGKIRRFMNAFSGGTALSYKATSLEDGVARARQEAAQTAAA